MSNQTEDPKNFDIKANNKLMLDQIFDANEGQVKEAATAGTNMIRRRIREEGFTRRIIPPQTVTNDDLDRVVTHDRPIIIEDMEPLSPGAKSIAFGDTADTATYYGNKFLVEFNSITTPEFTKDINELRTYRMDLRQVITDSSLKDIQTEEDGQFIAMVNTICGASNGVGASGVQQNFSVAGAITRENYVPLLRILENQNLNNGVFLMNRSTAKEFLKFDRSEIGGDLAEALFKEGLSAVVLTEANPRALRNCPPSRLGPPGSQSGRRKSHSARNDGLTTYIHPTARRAFQLETESLG